MRLSIGANMKSYKNVHLFYTKQENLLKKEGPEMKRNKKYLFAGLCAMIIVAFISGIVFSGETRTITGTVKDDYQIVADDGQVYEVGDTKKGDEVVDLVDKKVKVTGTVQESEGEKIINITSYEIIKE